jgi:ATP-binding cassette subfamily F protein uup
MALIDLFHIYKTYSTQTILKDVNFHIDEGDRTVIVGQNGSGKSTLMKIINDSILADEGERIVKNGLEIKMLDQNPHFPEGMIVRDAIMIQLKELHQAKNRYDKLSLLLVDDYENTQLINEHSKISAFLDHHNAWNLDDKIERVLLEFQLKVFENTPVMQLSGGEQRRVALAGLLLLKPDILLLDEPTNHLDVYMVEFLEELIIKEKFTVLFISHDRYFIDQIATKTIEIEKGDLRSFKGGYQNYLDQKSALMHSMQKQHENLLRILKTENEWYSRGVRARLKRNEGRKERLMSLREEAKINPSAIQKMKMHLEREKNNWQQEKSINKQKMLFEIENLELSLGNKLLIKNFSNRIVQKDRIAIVGKNGTGKSTLLKLILGRIKADKGVINQGEFKIGYFDQHRELLDDEKNIMEVFCPNGGDRVDVQGVNMHVFGYLKNFLFPKEFLDKKVGILSGGEKNRVALALLFTKKVDCLILDEPTNDLDIPTINILEEKILNFSGAVILVSHDRYFIDKLASKLFIFKGNGKIEESYQRYSEYLELEKEINFFNNYKTKTLKEEKQKKVTQKKIKLNFKEKELLKTLPQTIDDLENKIEKINQCLNDPNCYNEKGLNTLAKELEEKEEKLDEITNIYLELEEKQEEIEQV